jgi:hypothetical protein
MENRVLLSLIWGALVMSNLYAEDQTVLVRDDFGMGVKSKISILLGEDYKPKGMTDDTGLLSVNNLCQPGERVEAEPINAIYYKGMSDCRMTNGKILVKVTAKAFAYNLLENANMLANNGDYGTAALGFTEFAARMDNTAPEVAKKARMKAFISFAKSIGINDENKVVRFDIRQQGYVLTPDFVNTLKSFQEENGLKMTGQLDFTTVNHQAESTIISLGTNKVLKQKQDIQ